MSSVPKRRNKYFSMNVSHGQPQWGHRSMRSTLHSTMPCCCSTTIAMRRTTAKPNTYTLDPEPFSVEAGPLITPYYYTIVRPKSLSILKPKIQGAVAGHLGCSCLPGQQPSRYRAQRAPGGEPVEIIYIYIIFKKICFFSEVKGVLRNVGRFAGELGDDRG